MSPPSQSRILTICHDHAYTYFLTHIEWCAGVTPGLAVVLVGSRKDSETYVRSKKKGCAEAGIESFGTDLPETATEEEVLKVKCV